MSSDGSTHAPAARGSAIPRNGATGLILLAGGLAAAIWYLGAAGDPAPRAWVSRILLSLAPGAAAVLALRAARDASPRLAPTWRFFAAASLSACLGELVAIGVAVGAMPPSTAKLSFTLYLLFHPLFALGALKALDTLRDPRTTLDIALDAAMILTGGLVVLLRYLWEPLLQGGPASVALLPMLLIQLAAMASLFFACLLLLWEDTPLPSESVTWLALAAAVFTIGNIVVGARPEVEMPAGGPMDLLWLVGWGFMLHATTRPAHARGAAHRGRQRALDRLPRVIVPAAVLLLTLMLLETLRRPLHFPTAVALGVLGVLLAVRSGRALDSARERREQERRLFHTQTLVELSHNLAGVTELEPLLDVVSEWAARLLDAGCTCIKLVTKDGSFLETRSVYGLGKEGLRKRERIDGRMTGRVVRSGTAQLVTQAAAEDLGIALPDSLRHASVAAVPIRFRDSMLGVLFACRQDPQLGERDLEVLQALGEQAATAIENVRLFERVRTLSVTDPLTGLANRRQLNYDLRREFAAAQRGRPLAVVLLDLDDFKIYNDTYGHLAGDAVLETFGRVLGGATRAMNLAVRYGGDEFLALLAECTVEGAQTFVERLQRRFARALDAAGAQQVHLSAGIAIYDASIEDPEELIRRADEALYAVKRKRTTAS